MARAKAGRRATARRRRRNITGGVVAAIAATVTVAIVLVGFSEKTPSLGSPVLICIDSTVSTKKVRPQYLPGIEAVARRAANHQADFYADACGANPTGNVDWPVHARFVSKLGGDLGEEHVTKQVEEMFPEFEELLETPSSEDGTPFGEMLAVAAQQCTGAGGDCSIYIFTDGEWADNLIHVRQGVSRGEQRNYVKAYARGLGDLSGTTVNFIGVGLGRKISELHLEQAHKVATALIRAAEGEIGAWRARY